MNQCVRQRDLINGTGNYYLIEKAIFNIDDIQQQQQNHLQRCGVSPQGLHNMGPNSNVGASRRWYWEDCKSYLKTFNLFDNNSNNNNNNNNNDDKAGIKKQ